MILLRDPESFAAADDAENCESASANSQNLLFIYTTENPSVISFMSEQSTSIFFASFLITYVSFLAVMVTNLQHQVEM